MPSTPPEASSKPGPLACIMGVMVDNQYGHRIFPSQADQRQTGHICNQRTLKNLLAASKRSIDSAKWTQMLTNTTIPFDLPEEGVKIAVKVIDQFGMEHMTVIDEPRELLTA